MWEGLARTERQDRVLHGAAKLANLLLGIILLPLWLFGQLIGGRVRDFLRGLERRGRRPLRPARARAHHGCPNGRSPRDSPTAAPPNFAELRRGFADISNFVVAQHREGAVIGYRYPGQFKDHIVEGADGERIAASIALQEAARPALIVVHGLFTSSRFDYVRQIGVRAFYEWGFNVAALDLRSFGMTELDEPGALDGGLEGGSGHPLPGRLHEGAGLDQRWRARHLARRQLCAERLRPEATTTDLDGGILAVSPPAVPKDAWARLSEDVPRDHPRYLLHRAFEAALISRVRSGRWPPEAENMDRVMEHVSAPFYGVSAEEIWTHARGIDRVPNARVPLLILHPEDDYIVKAAGTDAGRGGRGQRPGPSLDPARRIARAARGR